MRIVVHAGMSKTGSTAIQKTLSAAAAPLAAAGIVYPALTRHPHHVYLLPAVLDPEECEKLFPSNTAHSEARLGASEQAWDRLAQAAAEARAAGRHTLVVSAEQIFGLRPASTRRLRDRLRAISDDIAVVGYVRSPAAHYLSSVQQALKFGHKIKPLTTDLTYRAKIRTFSKVFPEGIALRPFERSGLIGGDVCRDFLEAFLGLPPEVADTIPTLRDNESVSAEGMALLQEFHRVALPGGRRVGNPASKDLLRRIQAEEAKGGYTRPALLPAPRAAVEAANRADVLWLRDALGLTFADFDYAGKAAAAAAAAPEGTLSVADICAVDPDRLAHLRASVLLALLTKKKAPAAAPSAEAKAEPEAA
jgi:hypothetical protein